LRELSAFLTSLSSCRSPFLWPWAKLNREIDTALDDPKVKARLADLGGTVVPGSPADFGKLVVDDRGKVGEVDSGSPH
jgi:hypothetical protein